MIKQKETYEVPYGYRARVGLVVVGPNLNPTPEISRMLPDYVQMRETRIHMDPVVNIAGVFQAERTPGQCRRPSGRRALLAPSREPLGDRLRLHGGLASSADPAGTRRKWR